MYSTTAAAKDLPTFWASTTFNDEELRFSWTIHNFSSCLEDAGKAIQSPVLTSVNGLSWDLSLYPRGHSTASDGGHVSLYLNLRSSRDNNICPQVKFQFTILNAEQKPIQHNLAYRKDVLYNKFKSTGGGYGLAEFVKRDALIAFLKDTPLTISCEITICGKRIDTSRWSNNIPPVPGCTLSDDLESSFRDQSAGDTVIEVDGKEFLVYKGIIQARSSVFAAMFQCELEEQLKNRVIIRDFEPEVVEEMLIYIYTGKSPNLQAMANDLLSIADKYNLERLKMMSADVLSRKLTNDNAIETLILAELYRVNELKKFAINFIITNRYFLETSVWEKKVSSLSTTHPNLIAELMSALFASKM